MRALNIYDGTDPLKRESYQHTCERVYADKPVFTSRHAAECSFRLSFCVFALAIYRVSSSVVRVKFKIRHFRDKSSISFIYAICFIFYYRSCNCIFYGEVEFLIHCFDFSLTVQRVAPLLDRINTGGDA